MSSKRQQRKETLVLMETIIDKAEQAKQIVEDQQPFVERVFHRLTTRVRVNHFGTDYELSLTPRRMLH